MRRRDREVTDFEKIREIIEGCDTIRIGLADGAYPYIVPLSFGYEIDGGQIVFYVHGARVGRKAELMQKNRVCSFEMDCGHRLEIIPEARDVTMRYRCLMGTADIALLEDLEEKRRAMDVMMARDVLTRDMEYDVEKLKHTLIARLVVTGYTGKINLPGGNAD